MVTGKIVRAGSMIVSLDPKDKGERLTGFFVECSGKDLFALRDEKIMNENVRVIRDRRFQSPIIPSRGIGVKHNA